MAEKTFERMMPRIIVDYQMSDNILSYASFFHSFKSGGFNSRYGSPIAEPTSFDEETADSYELGFKSDFWQNRAHINAAAFYS